MVSKDNISGFSSQNNANRGIWNTSRYSVCTSGYPRYSEPSARNAPYGPTEAATNGLGNAPSEKYLTPSGVSSPSVIPRNVSAPVALASKNSLRACTAKRTDNLTSSIASSVP